METKEIIVDLQIIIQTMWKINIKKIIVTTYFIANTSNYLFERKHKWSKLWRTATEKSDQQQNDNWNAKQINRIHNFEEFKFEQ